MSCSPFKKNHKKYKIKIKAYKIIILLKNLIKFIYEKYVNYIL